MEQFYAKYTKVNAYSIWRANKENYIKVGFCSFEVSLSECA